MMWTIIEYIGVITGVIYLVLEFMQRPSMWIVSIINATTYILVYAYAKIYADMAFYVYNVGISCYGWFLWRKSLDGNKRSNRIEYCNVTAPIVMRLILIVLILFVLITLILKHLTDSPSPYLDALTTAISIVASWMTARRFLEHWIAWTIVNIISVPLYIVRDILPTAGLFTLYAVVSILGYLWWRKKGIRIEQERG